LAALASLSISKCIFIFAIWISLGFCDTSLSVKLSTQNKQLPTSIEALKADKSLSQEYVCKLLSVLQFDIYISGKTFLVDPKTHMRLIVMNSGRTAPDSDGDSVAPSVRIYPKMQEGILTLDTFLNGKGIKAFAAPLSGEISKDRTLVHQMAAKIHEALFNEKSIVSQKILYTLSLKDSSAKGGVRSEIWEADIDGYNARRISPRGDFCLSPIYIPKAGARSDHVLFVNYQAGQPKLHTASLHRAHSEPALSLRGNQLLPCLSPSKNVLAFICDAMGRADLFLHFFDGTSKKPVRFVSFKGATQSSPTFSPSGKKIAFTSDKSGSAQIYVTDVDITKKATLNRITQKNRQNTCPTWSPDGTKLAYISAVDGIKQVWIYDFEKEQEEQLTFDPQHKESPAWAPNSLHIIYNTLDNNKAELYLLHLGSAKAVKISAGLGHKKFPEWEPWAR